MLGFDCLTASEARDLRNTATSETIRARIKLADSRVTQASLMASPPEFAYKINNKYMDIFVDISILQIKKILEFARL